jgi:formylglycine-generating enzyme required for sulfatase activity
VTRERLPEENTSPYGSVMRLLVCVVTLLLATNVLTVAAAVKAKADAAGERSNRSESRGELNTTVAALAPGSTFSDCKDDCPEMVVIRDGKFLMGSEQYAREQPQHVVTFPAKFAVGEFAITFDEWAACAKDGGCSNNKLPPDEGWGRGSRPVINVSWADANDYVFWLSQKTGRDYRLLTESEWEYVARAGSTTTYPWGNSIDCGKARYDGGPGSSCDGKMVGRSSRGTQPVGRYAPDVWGLYDMLGNVWQWCQDSWHGNYRGAPVDGTAWQGGNQSMAVLRGGAWNYTASGLRSADRNWLPRPARTNFVGFRVARSLDPDIAMLTK